MLHRLAIEWPARLFTLWWTAYCLVLCVLIMVTATVTALSLALWTVGIRWGW